MPQGPVEAFRSKIMASPSQWGDSISSLIPPNRCTPPAHSKTYPPRRLSTSSDIAFARPIVDNDLHITDQMRENIVLSNRDLRSVAAGTSSSTTSLFKLKSDGIKPMASTHDWTLEWILKQGNNFHDAARVSSSSDTLSQTIREKELQGVPLVIEGFDKHPKWLNVFTLDRFSDETSPDINVRNVHTWRDSTMPLKEFIAQSRTSKLYREDGETERFYGKDSECPKSWEEWLQTAEVVPEILLSKKMEDVFQYRPDNPEATIQTLMCYLGIGDTFTPCHKDLCASSGQNLMCYTERDGSSFWFMTDSASAPAVAEYFRETLGQELDNENYTVTIQELANAPFNVYVIQQRLGDMVLVPPRSCHQVINAGGLTIKTSWSRMMLKGLSIAYHYELPLYRRVCRPETYRVKSTVHHAIVSLTIMLEPPNKTSPTSKTFLMRAKIQALISNLAELLSIYDLILAEEYAHDEAIRSQVISTSDTFNDDTRFVCDFCSGDIFQSFFECSECGDTDDGRCHLCPGCYVEGRSCKCGKMKPMQCRNFDILIQIRNKAAQIVKKYPLGNNDVYDPPLELIWFQTGSRALFQAACTLYSARINEHFKENMHTCTVEGHSHQVPFAWMLKCSRCQFNACFTHILADCDAHAAQALLLHSVNQNVDQYHAFHQTSKKIYNRDLSNLKRTQEQGRPPQTSGYHLLVANAKKHKFCAPINTKFMKIGWYDTLTQNITLLTPENVRSSHLLQNVDQSAPSVAELDSTDDKISNKRKHRLYVDVPQAPYNTKHRLASSTIATKLNPATASLSNAANLYPNSDLDSTSSNGASYPNIPANVDGDRVSSGNPFDNERSQSSNKPTAHTSLVKRNLSSLKFKKVKSATSSKDKSTNDAIINRDGASTSDSPGSRTPSIQQIETSAAAPVCNVAVPNISQDATPRQLQDPISSPFNTCETIGMSIGRDMAIGFIQTMQLVSSQMHPQYIKPAPPVYFPPVQPQRQHRGYAELYGHAQMADMQDIRGPYFNNHPPYHQRYHQQSTHHHKFPSRTNTHNSNRTRQPYTKDNYTPGNTSNRQELARLERDPNTTNGQRNSSRPQILTSGSTAPVHNAKTKLAVDTRRRQEISKSTHTKPPQRRFITPLPSEGITPPITQAKPTKVAVTEGPSSPEQRDLATESEPGQANTDISDLCLPHETPCIFLPSMDVDRCTSTQVEVPAHDSHISTDNSIDEEDQDWEMNYEASEDNVPHPALHFRTDGLARAREENNSNVNSDAMYDNPWST